MILLGRVVLIVLVAQVVRVLDIFAGLSVSLVGDYVLV